MLSLRKYKHKKEFKKLIHYDIFLSRYKIYFGCAHDISLLISSKSLPLKNLERKLLDIKNLVLCEYMWLGIRFSFRFFLRISSLQIIRPAPPVVPQQWSDLVTRVPCVTVGGPRGRGWGEQIISLHAWYPCPTLPAPTTSPAPERPVQGEEQLQALENMTPIKLWRPGSRSTASAQLSYAGRHTVNPGKWTQRSQDRHWELYCICTR